MSRRAHKKSRNGCIECKRRHIKCNESRPTCSNCIASERVCEYGINVSVKPRRADSLRDSAVSASLSSSTSLPRRPSSPGQGSVYPEGQPVNMLHMELFYHLLSDTLPGLEAKMGNVDLVGLIPHLLKEPYMANELLAFSALHLSTKHPERCEKYRNHATQLQTYALAIFQEGGLVIHQQSCVPAFMFSSFLGLHALCDALVHNNNSFAHFIDKFVHCFRLHQGVRAICSQAWSMLHQSVLKIFLVDAERQHHFDGRLGPGCAKLSRLIQAANLGATLTGIYTQAIEQLQVSANVFIPAALAGSKFFGAGWPLLVCPEYDDLLLQRRPEALVILAHYAIILQCCKESWIIEDGGHFIIQSTRDFLGAEWAEWLEWPTKAVEDPVKLLLEVYGC